MSSSHTIYQEYVQKMQRIADIRNATALLQWDQETYLPPKGAAFRGQQISTLTELAHSLFIEDSTGKLLQQSKQYDDLSAQQKRNISLTEEDYTKSRKYTPEFVRQLSDATNKAFHAWIEARKQNNFALFKPHLQELLALKRKEADVLGYEDHPYNALLNEYEKGSTVKIIDAVFETMLPALKELAGRIASKQPADDHFLQQHFPKEQQWKWGLYLIEEMGFDSQAGRQDKSEHPFSISFNPCDVRITTRVDEEDFSNMTWSCIHEAGHALYEQGLPAEQYGLPLGEACSYSIHESQSRLWENNVGRSKDFWDYYFPILCTYFPQQFTHITADAFYKGINKVQPSLIRTEADEITYHLHVYIRYIIEKGLIEGSINVEDIPHYWNELYEKWLGVKVPDDKRGCLQDVHWSHGSFGYFPTYSLGSVYAAQLMSAAKSALPLLSGEWNKHKSADLLQWLRTNVHQYGRFYTSEALCEKITGSKLDATNFVYYLTDKYNTLYSL